MASNSPTYGGFSVQELRDLLDLTSGHDWDTAGDGLIFTDGKEIGSFDNEEDADVAVAARNALADLLRQQDET